MKRSRRIPFAVLCCALVMMAWSAGSPQAAEAEGGESKTGHETEATGVIDQTVESLGGESVELSRYRGRPMLIVNTASKCGYTPQYEGLQQLHERYEAVGLVVIGFPSNDFGGQEPGSAEEIASFCRKNYGVTFPMMAKVHTRGPEQASVYRTLTTESAEEFRGEVQWNFTKFLIDSNGRVVGRFESRVEPLDERVTSEIDRLLEIGSSDG